MLTEITHISDKEKTTLRLDITDEQYKEIVEKYGVGNATVRKHKHTKMTPKENETAFSENHIHTEIVEKSNLAMVDNAEALEMYRRNLRTDDTELTRTGLAVAKINIAARKRKRGEK